ncbi:hypothetical protein PLESTM_001793600 [Pleodorina starrii]|nr:hypothetical protein PLESTM_001793600 [Pleodorina starrii]
MALGGFSVTNGRAAAGVVVRASSTALELESVELGLRNLNRDGVDPYSAHITRVALILTTERECCEQQGSGSAAVSKATAAITTDYSLLDLLSPCQGPLCSIVRATAVRALTPTTRLRDAFTAADLQALTDFHLTPSCSLHTRVIVCSIGLLYFGTRPSSGMARVLVTAPAEVGISPMPYDAFNKAVTEHCAAAGIKGHMTTHSMHIGAVTTAINGGTSRVTWPHGLTWHAVHIGAALSARPCASCPLVLDSSAPRAPDSA